MVRFSRPNTRTAPALPQTPSGPDDSLWIEFPLASNNAAYLTQPQISKPLLAGITHVLVTAPRDPINALGKYLLNHDRCRRELEEEARQKNGAGRDAGKPLSLEEFKEMQAKFKHSAWVKATAVQDAITNLKVVGVPEEEADASRTAEGDYLPQSVQKVIDEQDKEMQRMQGVERLILPREMLEARMGRSASVVSAEPRSTTPDFQPPSNSIAPAAMGRRYSTTPLESPPEICRGSIAGRASTQVARAEYTMEIEPSDAEAIEEITASKVDLAAEGGHDVVVAPHAAVVATMVSQPSSQDFGALAASGGILLPETRGLSIVGGILATQPSHLGLALETPLPPSRMPSIMGLASDDKPPLLSRQPSVPGPATDVPLPVSRQVSDMGLAMMTPLPPSNEPSRLDLAVDTAPAALATQPSHLGLALETPLPLSHQPSTTALASEKPISPKDEPSDVPTVSKPERDASGNALNVEDGDAGNRALSHTPRLSAMATGLVHDSHGVLEHDPLEGGPHEGETLVEAPHEEVFGGMGITGGSGGYGGLSLEGVLSEGLDAEAGGADEAAADAADDKADEVALMGSDSHALGLHSEAEAEAQFAQDGDAENPDFAAAEDENVGAGDDQPEL
ncbi:hypothetical protein HK101_010600 [Irineochytrium annulatum]|nr:hypothetical protein HK101_010600 [Irineochytrium annulatum]